MLARIWWIAVYEWRLIKRSRAFWVTAALLAALAWLVLEWPDLARKDPFTVTAAVAKFAGLLSSLLLIFLSVPSLLREFRPGHDMLWSRTVTSSTYFTGKVAGITLATILALLPAIGLTSAVMIWVFGFNSLKPLGYNLTVILAPTVAITLAVTTFVSLLFRHQLWAYLILIALRAGLPGGINIQQLTNFTLQGVYTSPLIGFGPETNLVAWNRWFYLAFALAIFCGVGINFHCLEPRTQRPGRLWQITLAGIFFLSFLGAFQSFLKFQEAVQRTQLPTQFELPEAFSEADYRLSVVADLRSSRLSGEATLILSNSSAPIAEMPLNLNPGLQVQRLLSQGNRVVLLENGKMVFDPPITDSETISLTIYYEGSLAVNHRAYDIFLSPAERSPLPGGYLGQGTIHLMRNGDWYPFANLWSPNQLAVTVPGEGVASVSTADQVLQVKEGQRFTWFAPPAEPLLAAASAYRQVQWPEATILYPPGYEHLLEEVVAPYINVARQLDAQLQPAPPYPLQVAIIPLLKQSAYHSTKGTLFLSEEAFKQYAIDFYHGDMPRDAIYQRWAAEIMTRVWWCQQHQCFPLPSHIGSTSETSTDTITETLLSYMALRLAEPQLGDRFIAEEIKDRVKVAHSPELHVYSPFPNLGISESLFVRLENLWLLIGPERFWEITKAYQTNYGRQHAPSLEEFEIFVQATTGSLLPTFDPDP